MNSYPCPLCNHFHEHITRAVACREYTELQRLEDEQYKHRQTCVIYNSGWYRGLWSNAVIGEDVVEAQSCD